MDIPSTIEQYIDSAMNAGDKPSLKEFVAAKCEFIASNTSLAENLEQKWKTLFINAVTAKNVELKKTRTKPDWVSVRYKMSLNSQNQPSSSSHSPSIPVPSSSVSSPSPDSKGTKRTRSSGSKTDSILMTETMLVEFRQTYAALEDDKKWKLPDGKYVDLLFQFADEHPYEHLAHSFVVNIDDPRIGDIFTNEQLTYIKNVGVDALPQLNSTIKGIFDDCSAIIKCIVEEGGDDAPVTQDQEERIVKSLWKQLTSYGFFDPDERFEEDWLQRTLLEILNWYRYDTLQLLSKDPSEMDFIVRVWSVLDKCFDDIRVQTWRDHSCLATTVRQNMNRGVTGSGSLDAEQLSVGPDLIFFRNDVEYGVGEVGKEEVVGVSQKELIGTQLHCPKVLKDMLNMMAKKCNNKESIIRSLRAVAYNQTCLRMSVLVLDCPGGYVCRVRTTKEYEVSPCASLMRNGVFPILKLALKSKDIVRKTTALVERRQAEEGDEDPDFECNQVENDADRIIKLPPAVRTSEKRQKS
ncbi:hypothetical protein BJV82DRAFT_246503 [Fennellomyces sp. T-0311]|nr:hypothetical protein BJV82DRAFT_246503 [Fennellomyces sp. T-0311]